MNSHNTEPHPREGAEGWLDTANLESQNTIEASAISLGLLPKDLVPEDIALKDLTPKDLAPEDLTPKGLAPKNLAQRLLAHCVLAVKNWLQRQKTHYYHIADLGTYFFLEESTEFADEIYITSYQALVKATDLIKIEYASQVTTYRIIELQHYSNAPDIFVARLRQLPNLNKNGS